MTGLPELLSRTTPIESGFRVVIPASWLQGRTSYGGLSSALALHAAKQVESDLPPLRSAMIGFIGPLAGEVTVTAERLRRGRNAAFLEASVRSEAGLGLRATFVFMSELPSAVDHDTAARTQHAPPTEDIPLYTGPAEHFTGHFNFLDLKQHAGPAEWLRWGRLREHDDLDPETHLLAISDGLPPAAYKLADARAPLSSLTWMINLLVPRPRTRGGWWLLQTATERAVGGSSSQRMTIWNADGVPVADAMQSVAIFG